MRKKLFYLFSVLIFISCKTTKLTESNGISYSSSDLYPEYVVWENIDIDNTPEEAFQLINHTVKSRHAQWKCVKIDLDTPKLAILAEPSDTSNTKSFYLQNFSKKNRTVVSINTTPFDMQKKMAVPVGITKNNGTILTQPNDRYCMLGIKKENNVLRADIFESQNEHDIADYDFAFGGFFTILKNGEIYPFYKSEHSRTAAGISHDGRFLYLFAGCGINNPSGKIGFTYEECALILQKLGCSSAMEFDGGHSTGLTIKNKNAIKPSLQRKIPAAMGIKISE